MSAAVAKALFLDALALVLDNKVFRILFVIASLLISLTVVFAFREDRVLVLFGWNELEYAEVARMFDAPPPEEGTQESTIRAAQGLLVGGLAGRIGMLLSLVATCFFVPQLLEKGTADILFSKPVSRAALFLARYAAGLLFVFALAAYFVLGVHLGFRVVSGYSDPAFLWNALTLTYAFALVSSFAAMVGVLTRSTVASVLLSCFFFIGNGCVHNVWMTVERIEDAQRTQALLAGGDAGAATDEDPGPLIETMMTAIDVLHYALPKTSDAPYLVQMVRERVEVARTDAVHHDPENRITVRSLPEPLELQEPPGSSPAEIHRDWGDELLFAAVDPTSPTTLRFFRRERRDLADGPDETRLESTSSTGREMEDWLARRSTYEHVRTDRSVVQGSASRVVHWTRRERIGLWCVFGWSDRMYTVEIEAPAESATPEVLEARLEAFTAETELRHEGAQTEWYARRFGWHAPWKYNAFFSVGSSVAFAAVALFLGWLKLRRIDF